MSLRLHDGREEMEGESESLARPIFECVSGESSISYEARSQ